MTIIIKTADFDPLAELQQHAAALPGGQYGALASFVGSARDFNDGAAVQRLSLEHYPGMTEQVLRQIAEQAKQQWDILDALIVHRVGNVEIGDPIVLTAAWAAHREAAFAACRYLIETLKTDAPFWKKELVEAGERWVEKNH